MTQYLFLAINPSFDLAPNPCAGRDPVAVQSEFTLSNVEGSGGNINQKPQKMQNKPNFRNVAANINPYPPTPYKNLPLSGLEKTNPIQSQFMPKQTQFKAIFTPKNRPQNQNKPNSNPISVPQNSSMVYNAAEIYKELLNEH